MELDSYIEGDITIIANRLYDELVTTGYSLLASDVIKIIIDVCRDYIAWAGMLHAFERNEKDDSYPIANVLDADTQIYNDEWSIMRPVVKARCDIMQAKRMEGAQNLGVQPVGISSSEAEQNHREAMIEMKREAFNTHPFSVNFVDLNQSKQTANTSISINHNFAYGDVWGKWQ